MKIGEKGLALLKSFEGCKLVAYLCPAKVWTIGYGHTGGVKEGDKITQARAEELLRADLAVFEACVAKACPKATQNEFDALVCFTYNVGTAAFLKSTLLKKVTSGLTHEVVDQFMKWTTGGGKVLPGLVKRRMAEAELYRQDPPLKTTKPA